MGKTALVAGGSGLVGTEVVRLLLSDPQWERVIALTRRPLAVSHSKLREMPLPDLTAVVPLTGDALFCCLGTTIKIAGSQAAFRVVDHDLPLALARAARAGSVPHYLLVSALGADPRSRVFYSRVKGELELALSAIGFPRLTIAQPSLLLGQRTEARPGEGLSGLALGLVGPLLVGPLRHLRAIPAATVAAALVAAAGESGPAGKIVIRSGDMVEAAGRGPKAAS